METAIIITIISEIIIIILFIIFIDNPNKTKMPDITKCTNESCPLKESCYRWTSNPTEHVQSYCEFYPNVIGSDGIIESVECDNFLEDKSTFKTK